MNKIFLKVKVKYVKETNLTEIKTLTKYADE